MVNVPHVPGVPALAFSPIVGNLVALLTQDAISLVAGVAAVPWGIYFAAIPVVLADNVVSFEYDQQFDISDYPIEGGQFASFNKVYRPFNTTLRFTTGGNLVKRQAFLDSIAAIIGDLNEYNVVTADAVYLGLNLVGYHYKQTADSGVGLIQVDVAARQVKNAVSPTILSVISSPVDPGATPQVNGGVVQPLAPTATQNASVLDITVHGGS